MRLHGLLTNPVYIGKIRHKQDAFDGEHEALIDVATWDQVQALLRQHGRNGGLDVRNRHGALLKSLVRCRSCGRAMIHTFTERCGRRYRYYTCSKAIKEGYAQCPSPSLPAAEIERVVVDQIRGITRDRQLADSVLAQMRAQTEQAREELRTQQRHCEAEIRRHEGEIRRLATGPGRRRHAKRLTELHDQVRVLTERLDEIGRHIEAAGQGDFYEAEVRAALRDFDTIWPELSQRQQMLLLALLVARVEYDAAAESVAVTFHDAGIKSLESKKGEP